METGPEIAPRRPACRLGLALTTLALLASAAGASSQEPPPLSALSDPREIHLQNIRQLTFGGENAEAYWAPNSQELILQSTHGTYACDQIFRLPAAGGPMQLVSTGKGRTTCSYFFYPDAKRILYASTDLAGPNCPPPPDQSQGYVWALYPSYEIFTANPDGSDRVQLTHNQAYDAEATVCQKDGSILFTSTRDGDIDLYRMDADGGNVRRLTDTPGYDGGAFFSPDCKQIVWRASRPAPGKELDDFRALLAQGLVRPSKLELWIAEADGTHARQLTYLASASFGPSFFPDGKRIIFSSNYPDPRGREFDLWAINIDGTGLERITYAPAFDGFPMFSPDGKSLVFASNRHDAKPGETNIFVASFVGAPQPTEEGPADRFAASVAWLADDAREGRGIGTQGLKASADWLEARLREIGLEAPGGSYRQAFDVAYDLELAKGSGVWVDGQSLAVGDFVPAGFSASADITAEVVPVGHGIVLPEQKIDDYAGKDVQGKIVAVQRFTPEGPPFDQRDLEQKASDPRFKAFLARERGALGVIMVDAPGGEKPPEEAVLPKLEVGSGADAGLPVVTLKRAAGAALFAGGHRARIAVSLLRKTAPAENILGVVRAGSASRLPGALVLGAHYDHLGFGPYGSLEPDSHLPHNGADDNASGVAALLEAARQVVAAKGQLQRDVWFVAFAGEERGLLGSAHLMRQPVAGFDPNGLYAMVNMDMVGRMQGNQLSVLGASSAKEWESLVAPLCAKEKVECRFGGDGYGPSDQTSFYANGVPVLHLFTGVHDDYHKPSDDAERINAAGGGQVASLAADTLLALAGRPEKLSYQQVPSPPEGGDVRSYGASLGTIPDYAAAENAKQGVPLAGVRPGSPAEQAGIRRGDLLVELAGHPLANIYDFVYVLRQARPGQRATAVVERDGKRIELVVVFGENRSGRV